MTDPYKILGVSPSDDEEKIKQAYRELVRKYHPDKYAGTDLAEMANEKMKEINAAYEQIQKERRDPGRESFHNDFYGSGAYQQQSYGYTGDTTHAAEFAHIRSLINSGNLDDAQALLRNLRSLPPGGAPCVSTGSIRKRGRRRIF